MEKQIVDVSSFLTAVSSEFETCVFRGEREYYSHSMPSFYRENSVFKNLDIEMFIRFMFSYIKHSPHIATELPNVNIENMSLIEKQHILQHYDMPTKLLDVSKNPLVALYFSCVDIEGNLFSKDGYVKLYEVQAQSYPVSVNSELEHHALYKMPMGSIRAKVQNGDVIYFEKEEDLPPKKVLKIPVASKIKIIKELRTLGICYEYLFPSLKNEMAKLKEDYVAMNDTISDNVVINIKNLKSMVDSFPDENISSGQEAMTDFYKYFHDKLPQDNFNSKYIIEPSQIESDSIFSKLQQIDNQSLNKIFDSSSFNIWDKIENKKK